MLVFVMMSDMSQLHPWRCPTPRPPSRPRQSPRPSYKKKSLIHRSLLCLWPLSAAKPSPALCEQQGTRALSLSWGRAARVPSQAAASPPPLPHLERFPRARGAVAGLSQPWR